MHGQKRWWQIPLRKATIIYGLQRMTQVHLVGICLQMYLVTRRNSLRVAVNPERRKDGIGQLLMDAYLAFVRIDAVRGLLEVRHGNGAAKHLYEKNGYHLLACRKNYYKHPDEDADIYEIAFTENGE